MAKTKNTLRGRPSKIEKVQKLICQAIRQGMTHLRAAELAGVCEKTFYTWKVKGENSSSGKYYYFSQLMKRAELYGEQAALKAIREAGEGTIAEEIREVFDKNGICIQRIVTRKPVSGSWTALAWILERRFPDRWGRKISSQECVEDKRLRSANILAKIEAALAETAVIVRPPSDPFYDGTVLDAPKDGEEG